MKGESWIGDLGVSGRAETKIIHRRDLEKELRARWCWRGEEAIGQWRNCGAAEGL